MLRELRHADLDDGAGFDIVAASPFANAAVSLRAAIACLLLVLATRVPAAPVSGRVGTPTGVVPALTLYAWSPSSGPLYQAPIASGQATFTIELPRGRYWLFAAPADPGAPPVYGAYTDFAACAQGAKPRVCKDHALKLVTVGAKGASGIELNDWYLDDALTRDLDRILGRPSAEPDEAELAAPKFSEYPAPPYGGAHATALAAGADARLERDHEALAAALAAAANFAGRMALVRVSCGTGCEQAALVDVASGKVAYPAALAELPAAAPCTHRGVLLFRRDSRLLTVTGRHEAELVTRYFVWDGDAGQFKLVASLASALEERCMP
jgi:hypothetical protein